jgi:hypothetical protein
VFHVNLNQLTFLITDVMGQWTYRTIKNVCNYPKDSS